MMVEVMVIMVVMVLMMVMVLIMMVVTMTEDRRHALQRVALPPG